MSPAELKTKLIEKIRSTDDQQILKEAMRLLDIHHQWDSEAPYELTEKMHTAVDEARKQIKNREYLSHKEATEEIEKWLGE